MISLKKLYIFHAQLTNNARPGTSLALSLKNGLSKSSANYLFIQFQKAKQAQYRFSENVNN